MKAEDVNRLIKQGESEKLEFKTSFNKEVVKTIVAFANTKGGKILIGISDKGKVVGININDESVQNWINEIKSKTEPVIIPKIELFNLNSKNIVLISINEYPVKPISTQGRFYKRVGNSNHLLSASEVSDCFLEFMQYSWDTYLYKNAVIEDLDKQRIKDFFSRVNQKARVNLFGDDIEKLKKLNLLKDNTPTNAAMLLFAKEPLMYDIHIGRLKSANLIIDDKIIRNTLIDAVEETMRYLISNIKVAYDISEYNIKETTQRKEIFEYPLEALRELVLNAIIHRKYSTTVDVQIKIFDHKIAIFSPGELYGNISVEDLKHDDY